MASYEVVSLRGDQTVAEVRTWIAEGGPGSAHHGFPVVDAELGLVGLVSRRDLLDPGEPATKRVREIIRGPFVVAFEDTTLQEASDLMAREGLGRLPVVKRENPRKVVAILSGSDVRYGIRRHLQAADQAEQTLHWL
jgi:CBS domain-containing protein